MWTIPYLVCVLCVQWIARDKRELVDPSTTSERRSEVERNVQTWEGYIKFNKELIEEIERNIDREREALQVLLPPSESKWLISGN